MYYKVVLMDWSPVMAAPDLADLSRRPARYWHVDGLPELMLGLLWMIWGAAWLIGERLPHDWRWTAYWLVVPPALTLSGFAVNRLTRWLKTRVTFPRTGYVEWQAPDTRERNAVVVAIVGFATVLALAVLIGRPGSAGDRTPAVVAGILSLSFLAVSVRQRAPHLLAVAAAAAVLTVVILTLATGFDALNWFFLALGAFCTLAGAVRLTLFVRHHPRVTAEDL
jgi:hypothetical protein